MIQSLLSRVLTCPVDACNSRWLKVEKILENLSAALPRFSRVFAGYTNKMTFGISILNSLVKEKTTIIVSTILQKYRAKTICFQYRV